MTQVINFCLESQAAKSWLSFLCNMNQSFANETQIDQFRLDR